MSAVFVVWEIRNPQSNLRERLFAEIGEVCFTESPMFRFDAPTCEMRVNTFSYHGTGGFYLNAKGYALIKA